MADGSRRRHGDAGRPKRRLLAEKQQSSAAVGAHVGAVAEKTRQNIRLRRRLCVCVHVCGFCRLFLLQCTFQARARVQEFGTSVFVSPAAVCARARVCARV